MQRFTSPISTLAGGPRICRTAPALLLAALTSVNVVVLVPDLVLPGSTFICTLDTANNLGDE